MEPTQSPDRSPDSIADLASSDTLPPLLYPLEKELLYPRLIIYTFSADKQDRQEDLERLSQALRYIRQKSELLLNEVEISELIEILSKHERGNPPRSDLENLADSIGVTHSRYFRLTPEGSEFRIRSQMDLDQEDAPIPTHLSIQLNYDSHQRDPIPTILLNWPEQEDLESEDKRCDWKLADPILFALSGRPLPTQIRGEDSEDHTYLITVSSQVSIGVAYLPDKIPTATESVAQVAFVPLKTIAPSALAEEEPEVPESTQEVSKSNCAVSCIEVIEPSNRELALALSSVGIMLPEDLVEYLTATVTEGSFINADAISEFSSLSGIIRISQVSYVRYVRDSTLEDLLEEDLSEDADTEEEEEDGDTEEDQTIEDIMVDSIDIALELPADHERITVSLSLSEEFDKNRPSLIARLEFFSPSNCFTEEQVSERWAAVEKFVGACNGPKIPEKLEKLTRLDRTVESAKSYQLDPAGRFLITPE